MEILATCEIDGWKTENYDAVAKEINWPSNWPDGLEDHVAGPSDQGMRLVEVWGPREDYDRWMEGTIQPAIQKVAADAAESIRLRA